MSPVKVVLVTLLAGGISVGSAILGERLLTEGLGTGTQGSASGASLATLPDFSLPDLNGQEVASRTWAGQVLVINYWASWCPPCLREMPMLIRAQEALAGHGVRFVGIAIDRAEDARAFVSQYPVNYPVLVGNPDAVELSRRLGNRLQGLPFTVIFDRRGRRVFSRTGELGAEELWAQLEGLLGISPGTPPPGSPTGAS
ncbi:MAG: TlpA family protein disulfide reductase [Bdellovibrio bacteriovorus]